jgi:hypothetical protein
MSENYEFVYNHLTAIYVRDDVNISVANIDDIPSLSYHIYLNITGDVLNATYVDEDSSNGVLTANHNWQIDLQKSDYNVQTSTGNLAYPGMNAEEMEWGDVGHLSLKDSLVGTISKALFNQFDQRAAIRNDMELEDSLYNSVNEQLELIFTDNTQQDKIFQRYVSSGRYAEDDLNDLNAPVAYNLKDSIFRFGFVFYGLIDENEDNGIYDTTNILDGVGFESTGIPAPGSAGSLPASVGFTTEQPAYQFNVLLQIHQNIAT